jgi:hypothetical protein
MTSIEEPQSAAGASVVGALARKYPAHPRAVIEQLVIGEMGKYRAAKVHAFVPVLVQRSVDAQLRRTGPV